MPRDPMSRLLTRLSVLHWEHGLLGDDVNSEDRAITADVGPELVVTLTLDSSDGELTLKLTRLIDHNGFVNMTPVLLASEYFSISDPSYEELLEIWTEHRRDVEEAVAHRFLTFLEHA